MVYNTFSKLASVLRTVQGYMESRSEATTVGSGWDISKSRSKSTVSTLKGGPVSRSYVRRWGRGDSYTYVARSESRYERYIGR